MNKIDDLIKFSKISNYDNFLLNDYINKQNVFAIGKVKGKNEYFVLEL